MDQRFSISGAADAAEKRNSNQMAGAAEEKVLERRDREEASAGQAEGAEQRAMRSGHLDGEVH